MVRTESIASQLRSRSGLTNSTKLQQRLGQAGLRQLHAADLFFAAQIVSFLGGLLFGSLSPVNTLFWSFALGTIGFMLPDFWLTSKAKGRRERIRRGIPDAVDLLAICVGAGLGLDQALVRVSVELSISHPDIDEEFNRLNLERLAGKPRIEAWQAMAERTGVAELSAFVTMLLEADRFGTPIVSALTSFSEETRLKRRQRAEEAAAKTKIKIIFPLVLCIFPCIFIVLLAPALLSIADGFKGMAQ